MLLCRYMFASGVIIMTSQNITSGSRRQSGFSLIELLVVPTIIALLGAVVGPLPSYQRDDGLYLQELSLADDALVLSYHPLTRAPDGKVIQQAAMRAGMDNMRTDGIRKALAGVTTVEEVTRVTQGD